MSSRTGDGVRDNQWQRIVLLTDLIEVNVRAEKYFDWWGWQEAPPPRRPESLTCKAVRVTEGNSLTPALEYWWRPQWGRLHYHSPIAQPSVVLLNPNTLESQKHIWRQPNGGQNRFRKRVSLEVTSRPKVSPWEETGARVDFTEVADDEEEEGCSLSWWAV